MKLKKIFAGMAASAIAMTTLAVSASASTAYVGGIQGYKGSTEIDGTTGEAYKDADAAANYFYDDGEDENPVDVEFSTTEVDFANGGTYTVSTKAPGEGGFNKTNSLTVLGLYIKLSAEDVETYGLEDGLKNIAGAVTEDEADAEKEIPYDISIDEVAFDGSAIGGDWNSNYGAYIMNGELKVELVNMWNTDISDNAFMEEAGKTTTALGAPVSEVSITFTITPKNGGTTNSDTSSTSSSDSSASSTGSTSSSGGSTTTSKSGGSTTTSKTTSTASKTTSSASSDDTENAPAGAPAGIALALAAVAGAAIVVSRRK